MRKKVLSLGLMGGALLATQVAQAHLLSCDKTVNGVTYLEVSNYPATLSYVVTINNASPEFGSDVLSASDPLLEGEGYFFSPAPPFSLALGESKSYTYPDIVLADEAACLALAAKDGTVDDRIDNLFETSWDGGSATCMASVVCKTPPPPPPPPSGVTRTMGFYKTHEQALSQCLAALPISLDLSSALGLLWGSPAVYDTGDKRSEIDRDRFILERQLLTAACNAYLFPPVSSDITNLIIAGFNALSGTDCALMLDLKDKLEAYNQSGDGADFPSGFDAGPATPQHARSIADDPTTPSGDQCGG